MAVKFNFFRKVPWTQLLMESAVVVLSVLFALAINTWHQNVLNNELAAKALINLKMEIQENKGKIKEVIPEHNHLLDTLSSKHPPAGIICRTAAITDNAWRVAQSMGAVPYIKFNMVSSAANLQETQQEYLDLASYSNKILLQANFGFGGDIFRQAGCRKGSR